MSSLRARKFNKVVRESSELIEQVFAQVGESPDLLKYLILEVYLNDTYYQYISLFHSGRLSPNDNNFLIKIRAYNNPPPDFPLDNVAEVIASMRTEDFSQPYVLNRSIMDHLLGDAALHSVRVAGAMDLIASDFQACGEFFRSYYATGGQVEKLVATVMAAWPDFVSVATEDTEAASHVIRILAFSASKELQRTASKDTLRSFLSENLDRVLAEQVEFRLDRLRSLGIQVAEIARLIDYPDVLKFLAREGLYAISVENIGHILSDVIHAANVGHLERRYLSTLNEVGDADLLKRTAADFTTYMNAVLLTLESNTEEDAVTIVEVLKRNNVDRELRVEFLERQDSLCPDLGDIPMEFHCC